ncbi:MAG: hypothetical protein QXE31_05970 [Candidatus Woesearchaeota archaeon]
MKEKNKKEDKEKKINRELNFEKLKKLKDNEILYSEILRNHKSNITIELKEDLDRLEVLADIYFDFSSKSYPNKSERDIAKLKMELIKKEMMLLNFMINKKIENL